jgi:FkbM family methyltransferase
VKLLLRKIAKQIPFAKRLYHMMREKSPAEIIDARDDAQVALILPKILKSDSNCVDVGAHVGDVCAKFVELAPRGRHFAFEAIPLLAEKVRLRFPQMTVRCLAISDQSGQIEFNWVSNNPAYSGIKARSDLRKEDHIERIQAETAALDTLIPSDVVVRLIKVDVEGGELGVFRGADRILREHKPFIIFEHGSASKDYGTTSADIFQILSSHGLRIWRYDHWLADQPAFEQASFIACVEAGQHWNFLAGPTGPNG